MTKAPQRSRTSASKKKTALDKASVAIVYRMETTPAVTLAKALANWLKVRGYKVFTAPEQKLIPGTTPIKTHSGLGKMGLLVVLGGDGTYLRAVRMLEGEAVPILGVNLGSLGFLTPTRADEVFTAVELTLQNKMQMRPRSMLHVTLFSKKKKKLEVIGLNDVVIERGSLSQLINIETKFDGQLVAAIKADGMIVSSPTGSTAYNLAAGGPILHPDVQALVVTPISPHSLTSRPTIFPDNKVLSFRLIKKLQAPPIKGPRRSKTERQEPQEAHLVVDGQKLAEISAGDEVFVTRSLHDHYLVKDPDYNYFELLRAKLKFGDRE